MKVLYTETALAEVDEILAYIAKDNPLAADEVSVMLQATVRRLADYPRLAIETDEPNVRVTPVLPYRYLIFYSVDRDTVIVRNIRHAARDRLDIRFPQ
jgi:toxin ParE1/3/4